RKHALAFKESLHLRIAEQVDHVIVAELSEHPLQQLTPDTLPTPGGLDLQQRDIGRPDAIADRGDETNQLAACCVLGKHHLLTVVQDAQVGLGGWGIRPSREEAVELVSAKPLG